MQTTPVDQWVKQLEAIPRAEFTIPRVWEFVRRQPLDARSLASFVHYSKGTYTRNLIHKVEQFEVLAICWEPGQVSRIHNHRGQNCWMTVPIGKLRVQNFRVEQRDARAGTCRLTPTHCYDMDPQHPGYVDPAEPVHQVLNLPEFAGRAASIHIYSYPYNTCEIYQRESGRYFDVDLHYTSEYGKLNPQEKLL